jgi:hypothetical protein
MESALDGNMRKIIENLRENERKLMTDAFAEEFKGDLL